MRKIFWAVFVCITQSVMAAESGVRLDKADIDLTDGVSVQRGARTFVNYCLGCHQASYMRFNRLQDIGLTNDQIERNLIFGNQKVGDTMQNPMRHEDAENWFGVAPPDLSVIARSRGADWLYTFLRAFYQDLEKPTGWNNLLFPNVGMPHVLWELQGVRNFESNPDSADTETLVLKTKGRLSQGEYDMLIRDLVNYLVFMGEPVRTLRVRLGIFILFGLSIFLILAWGLKKEYWKDVHN